MDSTAHSWVSMCEGLLRIREFTMSYQFLTKGPLSGPYVLQHSDSNEPGEWNAYGGEINSEARNDSRYFNDNIYPGDEL